MGGMSNPCPVCGHVDGACKGRIPTNERQIITSTGLVDQSGPERVPMQRGRIGKAGYVGQADGRVEVYDPKVPNIKFVQDADVEEAVIGGGADSDNPPRHEDVHGATVEAEAFGEGERLGGFFEDAPKPKRARKKKADE